MDNPDNTDQTAVVMSALKNNHQILNAPSGQLISHLSEIVGAKNAITEPALQEPFVREWRDRWVGRTPVVLRPNSSAQVSAILRAANEARVGVVPQSGNTGLVGGQIPSEDGTQIVLSLSRLNKIRAIASNKQHMSVEAGLTLSQVKDEAEAVGRLYPLAMASAGSCQIGGTLATNAGGLNVLAYGSARNLVSGLEVVLADGRVWDGMRELKKDNSGFDLRDLFVGSEGTLGIITAAVLKLFDRPLDSATAFLALSDLRDVARLFDRFGGGDSLTAFEFMPARALEFVLAHVPGARMPMEPRYPWYVLLEVSEFSSGVDVGARLLERVERAMQDGVVADGVIAGSVTQARELWQLREAISGAQKPEGGSIKHDVSVPIARIPDFIDAAGKAVERVYPGARPVPFGHFGDGNVHYNVSQPVGADREAFLAKWETMNSAVHDIVVEMGGSISAEHGIGVLKRDSLAQYKSEVELDMMRSVKASLDPRGILNPGKLL